MYVRFLCEANLISFSKYFSLQSPRLIRKQKLCKKVSDTSTCSLPCSRITTLILVIHGGTQIDTGLDPTSRDMDFKLLHDAFEAVINSHYKGAVGKIALRLVECPAICSKALNLLSQLCPYSESDSGKEVNSVKQSTLTTATKILFYFRVREYNIVM